MQFLADLFGPYPWPQITNVHRVEGGGGTEFPMMIMDSDAGEGLIVHEIAHQWAHGILANNEWKEGWLDEGMASFVGFLYTEAQGRQMNFGSATQGIARADAMADAKPIQTRSADFKDMQQYGMMTYTKAALVFRMLRDLIGDEDFRAGLRRYYQDNRLEHVDEADFRAAMKAESESDLDWFFQQWLHTNQTLDYAVTNATSTQLANGKWQTRVEVSRTGQAWMPVRLKVGDVVTRLDSRAPSFTATVETATRPTEVLLDPDVVLIDLNRDNNLKVIGH
jgi:aminopeptidase N